jgi:hypothetical protein
MSKYYKINGLKVRVSDHEPNHAMNKFRGTNNVEFYTKSADNRTLSVVSQVEWYCEDNNLDISLFSEVLEDFRDAEIISFNPSQRQPVVVTQSFIDGFFAISKKKISKRYDYAHSFGFAYSDISENNYIINN